MRMVYLSLLGSPPGRSFVGITVKFCMIPLTFMLSVSSSMSPKSFRGLSGCALNTSTGSLVTMSLFSSMVLSPFLIVAISNRLF